MRFDDAAEVPRSDGADRTTLGREVAANPPREDLPNLKKVGALPCATGANMRQYSCSLELNSVATGVRTGVLKAVGLKPMESR